MRKLVLCLLLLGASSVHAQYLINEDFEGTGTPIGWFRGGSANFDYSASPLAGSQSLLLDSATADYAVITNGGVINHAELWFKVLFRCNSISSDQHLFNLQDAGFNDLYSIILKSSDKTLIVEDTGAGVFANTVDALTVGTIYNIWGHYKKGSGANGTCEASFDVAGNPRPNSGNKFAGGNTSVETANATAFRIVSGALGTGQCVYDNVQIASTDIFGAPATTNRVPQKFFLFQ